MIKIILEKMLALIGLFLVLFLAFFWIDGVHPYEIFKTVTNMPKTTILNQELPKESNQELPKKPTQELPKESNQELPKESNQELSVTP
ncbi:MAG: hypothetical protein ACLTFB_02520 [Candidatus Phytoplasma pyri]|uniref:hypothetical protein n=1 Tax=Candidatus Phytoplasma pyri TaxID=47566 RepID=UPI003982F678